MKKILIFCLAIIVLAMSCSCAPIEIHGINNFNINDSSTGLNVKLLPNDNFLSDYKYIEGNYYFFDKEDWVWGFEKTIVYLSYSSEEYVAAKEYCLNNLDLSKTNEYKYAGYIFIENISMFTDTYPKQFNMFGFNDVECTLMFLGYFNGNPNDKTIQLAHTDWGTFLEMNFSEYYTFDN